MMTRTGSNCAAGSEFFLSFKLWKFGAQGLEAWQAEFLGTCRLSAGRIVAFSHSMSNEYFIAELTSADRLEIYW